VTRLINILLLIACLSCYIDWGHDGSEFLFQMEFDILRSLISQSTNIPLVIFFPLIGEALIIVSLFINDERKSQMSTSVGLVILSLVVLPIFVLGIFTSKLYSILSTLPFFVLAAVIIIRFRMLKNSRESP